MVTYKDREITKVGVDFDGVILNHFLGRELAPKKFIHRQGEPFPFYLNFEKTLSNSLMMFRKPLDNVKEVLLELHNNGVSLILITARHSNVKDATYSWLLKNGIADLFDKIYLNEEYLSPASYKISVLKTEKPDLFIDDDLTVTSHVALSLPSIQVLKFDNNDKHKKEPIHSSIIRVNTWAEIKSLVTIQS